jgi:hypothetical protein
MFDPKNKKWKKDRNKEFKGEWKSENQIQDILEKRKSTTRPTQKGLEGFMELQNLELPANKFAYGRDMQLEPLHYSQFGYMQNAASKWPVNRSYGQLYPLGKDAFFKGRHKGVSSTFSQKFSEDHGLWEPVKRVQRPRYFGEFQYGGMSRKKSHCFGSSEPNSWTRGGIMNGYTGKRMAGIADNLYGYKGTQAAWGGYTGVGGAPSFSTQSIMQGLVPR